MLTALFGARYRAYSRPDAAYRLLQTANYDVRTRTRALSFLAGTEAKTSFLFLRVHALSLAEAVTRGEPRFVRWTKPRFRFLLVAQVCPNSMFDRPRHLRDALASTAQCSDDRRARAEGPSEGRVFRGRE